MALSASTGFFMRGNLLGGANTIPSQDYIIAGSATIKIGDAIRINTSGYAVRAAVGEAIGGVAIGLVDLNGVNLFSPRAQGTAGATLTADDQVAVSATNASDATRNIKVQVQLDPAGLILWYNVADSALAQTNLFQMFDSVAAGNQITVGSASDANGQWQLIKLDPDGDGTTTKGLFRVNENQFGLGLDSATAKVAA